MIERLLAAEAALERADIEVAGRLFGQVADADPRNAIAVVGLARVALRRDEREAARELARRALAIDPQEAAANRLLAELDAPATEPVPPARGVPAQAWWRRLLGRLLGRG
jgi:uncharacterized protein HemY